jgi:hypothetical protein
MDAFAKRAAIEVGFMFAAAAGFFLLGAGFHAFVVMR